MGCGGAVIFRLDSIKKSRSHTVALDRHPGVFSSGRFDSGSPRKHTSTGLSLAPSHGWRACVLENVFRWRVLFLRCNLSVFRGHCEVPELPSNVTCGLWFDPQASRSPQPPSKQIVINAPVVIFRVSGEGEGGCGVYNSRVLISRVWVRGAGRAEGGSLRRPSGASKVCFPFQLKAVFNLREPPLLTRPLL